MRDDGSLSDLTGSELLTESERLTTGLQDIVETAHREFDRPVAIDDRHFRLLAYTEHPADVDAVRMASILKHGLSPDVLAWMDAHHVRTATGPVRLPHNTGLGMDARVCVPIRCHGQLLGYFWLIDRDNSMTEAEIERTVTFADAAGAVLHRELLLRDIDRAREREFLRDILGPDPSIRQHAARQLVEYDLFVSEGRIEVVVARFPPLPEESSADRTRLLIDAALARVGRHMAPRHSLHLVRPDHGLLLASLEDPTLRLKGLGWLADLVAEEVRAALVEVGGPLPTVGAGAPAPRLWRADESYHQALCAARVATTVSSFDGVASWEELGVYRLLSEVPLDSFKDSAIHAGLRRLIETPRFHPLVQTLEVFLNNAGDAKSTADELFVHRTSLYHRLRRVEELAETDLRSGDERLTLHLSLKLARLQGLSWTDDADRDSRGTRRRSRDADTAARRNGARRRDAASPASD